MNLQVQIVEVNSTEINDFINYSKERLPHTNLIRESSLSKILNNIKLIDLLIIDTNHSNFEEIVNSCIESEKYVIFLSNDLKITSNFKNITKYDIIPKPIDFKQLIAKIKNYIKLINNDLLLKKEQEFSNSIINSISNPIFLTDGKDVIFANDLFYKLIDCISIEQINNKYLNIGDLFKKEDGFLDNLNNNWLAEVSDGNSKVCIFDEEEKILKYFTIQKIYLTHNNTNIIVLNDISHEITHKQELDNLLYTDNLTKLPNRAKLIDELQNHSINVEAVAILDINSFKEINDFFGHKIGDYILNEISKLINNILYKKNYLRLYKFPSDTYCITNTNSNKEEFISIIRKITETIYKKAFIIDQHEIDTRITAGISFSNKNNKLITADIALQSAKKDHKDYIVFYDELDKFQEYENNMLWTKKLKNAFVNDNIIVFYQPLINNKTLKVEKYECLVRMIDEEGKVISPYFFLDISKKSNQYTKITKIVIEKSFEKFSELPFEFSVNISYEDIEDPNFLVFIKQMLEKYDVSNKVVFEILEDENVKNYEFLIDFIDEIKKLGCKVAIDDFGSGYSNFEHLLMMNVDYLKIDASLIKNVATNENSYKITKTIIDFAKSLDLKTIAEFVENEEIFKTVKELGADFSQGYYFSAPISEPHIKDYKKLQNDK